MRLSGINAFQVKKECGATSELFSADSGEDRHLVADRSLLKSKGACSKLSQGTCRAVADMRRVARPERRCRRYPFCAPSGRCFERTIKSWRCGNWIWFVLYGKQIREDNCTTSDSTAEA